MVTFIPYDHYVIFLSIIPVKAKVVCADLANCQQDI